MKKTKLHLGCGDVYLLNGWTNIDMKFDNSYLAIDRPELVLRNGTTEKKYYKKQVERKDFLEGKFHGVEVCCDVFSDVRDLPYEEGTVDKILSVQVLEHFTYKEADEIFGYWVSLLKKGGSIHIDVPDMDGIMYQYNTAKTDEDIDWCLRQLFGSQKNIYNVHKSGYTLKSLARLFTKYGLDNLKQMPNIHTYPAVALKGIK